VSLNARSNRRWTGEWRYVADVRDASNSERPCRASSRNEKSPSTVDHGIHRPLGGAACVRVGDVPAAVKLADRVECRVEWPKASTFGCDRSNRSGLGCFVPLP
jgi:hypothetical protein